MKTKAEHETPRGELLGSHSIEDLVANIEEQENPVVVLQDLLVQLVGLDGVRVVNNQILTCLYKYNQENERLDLSFLNREQLKELYDDCYNMALLFGPQVLNAKLAYECLVQFDDAMQQPSKREVQNVLSWSGQSAELIDSKATNNTSRHSSTNRLAMINTALQANDLSSALEISSKLKKGSSDKRHNELYKLIKFWQSANAQILPVYSIAKKMDLRPFNVDVKSEEYALFIEKSTHINGDFDLDINHTPNWPKCLKHQAFFKGDLFVKGDIFNYCDLSGLCLYVDGKLNSTNLIAGGSPIEITGNVDVGNVVIAHDPGGWLYAKEIKCRLLWIDEHTVEAGVNDAELIIDNNANQTPEQTQGRYLNSVLPMLAEQHKEIVSAKLQKDNNDDIEDIVNNSDYSEEEKQQQLDYYLMPHFYDVAQLLKEKTISINELFPAHL